MGNQMTRDEARTKCIEVIDTELTYEIGPAEFRRKLAERILDSLHDIATANSH